MAILWLRMRCMFAVGENSEKVIIADVLVAKNPPALIKGKQYF